MSPRRRSARSASRRASPRGTLTDNRERYVRPLSMSPRRNLARSSTRKASPGGTFPETERRPLLDKGVPQRSLQQPVLRRPHLGATRDPHQVVGPPSGRSANTMSSVSSSLSQLVSMLDYEPYTNGLLSAVPEHEWRLIGVLLRKKEEDENRALVADQSNRMWEQKQTERKMIKRNMLHLFQEKAESLEYHNRYIHHKREQDRAWQAVRHLQKLTEQRVNEQRLLHSIRQKDVKTSKLLANEYDRKVSDMTEKVVQEVVRHHLAADRRSQHRAAQEWHKRIELVDTMLRVEDARQRRRNCLKDISQRAAIEYALSRWESTILRQQVAAMETARREKHAHHAAQTYARGEQLLRAREARNRRARDVALLCAQLRDAARSPSNSRRNRAD